VLLSAVVGAGTYYLFIEDLNIKLASEVKKEEELRSSFRVKSDQAANLEAYRGQMVEMERTLGALVAQLPSDTEVPGLLEDIDEKGTESNLNIDKISLARERVGEFYVELPINIDVRGGYHDLGAFVSGVAGMPRIVTLHDYDITSKNGRLQMKIAAKTYRYKSESE
jgi:type IV pilus assembly protein PilO